MPEQVSAIPRHPVGLWVLAIVIFGIGDVVSTTVGLSLGAVELHPVVGSVLSGPALGWLIALKALTLGICYVLWRLSRPPYRIGVPIGLTVMGIVVVAWNAYIVGVLFFQ